MAQLLLRFKTMNAKFHFRRKKTWNDLPLSGHRRTLFWTLMASSLSSVWFMIQISRLQCKPCHKRPCVPYIFGSFGSVIPDKIIIELIFCIGSCDIPQGIERSCSIHFGSVQVAVNFIEEIHDGLWKLLHDRFDLPFVQCRVSFSKSTQTNWSESFI